MIPYPSGKRCWAERLGRRRSRRSREFFKPTPGSPLGRCISAQPSPPHPHPSTHTTHTEKHTQHTQRTACMHCTTDSDQRGVQPGDIPKTVSWAPIGQCRTCSYKDWIQMPHFLPSHNATPLCTQCVSSGAMHVLAMCVRCVLDANLLSVHRHA